MSSTDADLDMADVPADRIEAVLDERRKFAVDDPEQQVTVATCARWRRQYPERSYTALADEAGVARSTVRYHTSKGCGHDDADRIADVQAAHEALGHPPSAKEVADRNPRPRTHYERYPGTWDETLEAAGVPTPAAIVLEELHERLDDRPPWQGFVSVRVADLAAATGLTCVRVGQTLYRLSDGDSKLDGPAGMGFVKRPRAWEVHDADGGADADEAVQEGA